GVAKAIADEPDLILMDIQLPVLNGYEATSQIRADPKLKATPIIAVSSYAMKGDEEKARASGCDDYVTKPYSPIQLLKLIRGALKVGEQNVDTEHLEQVGNRQRGGLIKEICAGRDYAESQPDHERTQHCSDHDWHQQ